MSKSRIALLVVAVSLVVVAVLVLKFQIGERGRMREKNSDEVNDILEALPVSTTSTNGITYKVDGLQTRLKNSRQAAEKLRANPAVFLPRVMEEVYAVERVEATNRAAAAKKTERLALAFEALGGEARPLLPKLKEEFDRGRSIGPCVAAFRYIGGTDCGLMLVSGHTNADQIIRHTCVSGLSAFATNREVALSAVPGLLSMLKDNSALSKVLASGLLGTFRIEHETVIPALIQVAEGDSDFIARISAIKAIGRFGTNGAAAKPPLEKIAIRDEKTQVRRIASVALRAVSGDISPDDIR